ncbi:enoyl-CoA hydratase/isomerase family protein [Gammaproteobacteria bacterium]|nr:enoyl-CoA hydratase/isomerase family protein [Gammaproteobacteria bacterium]
MSTNDILFEEIKGYKGNIGLITLNRPKALNALNHSMYNALSYNLKIWEGQPSIKAVLIKSSSSKAFCAGGDIKSVYERTFSGDNNVEQFFVDEYSINRLVFHYPKPYIALLDGITMGGGAGVSLHGSHCIATENMSFAMPETSIGFFPDVGGSYFLSRIPNKIGVYLGLTGCKISYKDAYHIGLINYIISSNMQVELMQELLDSEIPNMQSVTKIITNYIITPPPSDLMNYKDEIFKCFSHKSIEKIFYSLGVSSEWSQNILALLKTKSPLSLKVTLEELKKGEFLDFDACMSIEYKIMHEFLKSNDLFEGIRALIIDKDKNPQWQPNSISEINDNYILNTFFT